MLILLVLKHGSLFNLKIFLVLKPILTDINVVILALLWVLLHDIYIFHPFASASLYL